MKIDRFVRVMLVLIALLLALNCAKDLKLSSNSREVSNSISPNSGQPSSSTSDTVVRASNEPNAGVQYDVIHTHMDLEGKELTEKLNQRASSGWRVKAMATIANERLVIMEK